MSADAVVWQESPWPALLKDEDFADAARFKLAKSGIMRLWMVCVLFPLFAALAEEVRRPAAVSSMSETELAGFADLPAEVQRLIRAALALTKKELTYVFGSHDPSRGGMDCSGTIYHLLTEAGLQDVPRQSDEMCSWVEKRTKLHRIEQADSLTHAEFSSLQPGDLVFWSGTYEARPRKVPVTHVMLYLGKKAATGRPVDSCTLAPVA